METHPATVRAGLESGEDNVSDTSTPNTLDEGTIRSPGKLHYHELKIKKAGRLGRSSDLG